MRYILNTAQYSQIGRRTNQEDSLYPHDPTADNRIFLVCDGVGGSAGGELASRAVCNLIPKEIASFAKGDQSLSDAQINNILGNTFAHLKDERIGSAATTMALLYLNRKEALIVHIGDSRVYRFRPADKSVWHTKDHSVVQELVDAGMLTEEQARTHPNSNIITKAIRALHADEQQPQPAIHRIKDIRTGDIFLLCSDGVWGQLTADQLCSLMTSTDTLAQKRQTLAHLTANSHDNNTAILVEMADVKRSPVWPWGK